VNARGFTLVEMLVVLVIMGLLAATVVLTWPTGGALRDDASALAARATLAAEESILSGTAMGLDVSAQGYAFYRMENGMWREVDDERAFRRHVWREGVVPQIRREGFGAHDRRGDEKAVSPTLIFDPTGLVPAFSVTLAEGATRLVVASTARGVMQVTEPARE
jgi:general secretion pathway protein H